MNMFLDIRTLFLVCGAVSFSLALPMLYTSAHRKIYDGFHLWTGAFIVNGLGMVILSLRGVAPDFITIVVANALMVFHLSLIGRGLLHFVDRPSNALVDILPTTINLLCFVYFTYAKPDVNARVVVVSFLLSVVYGHNFWVVRRSLPLVLGVRNRLLCFTFLFAASWFAMRVILTLFFEGQIADFMAAGTLHGLTILVYCLVSVIVMTGLVTINGQRLEMELRESEERYRLLFSQSPMGVVQIDRHGVIVDLNEVFAALIGAPKENLIGFRCLEGIENPSMVNVIRDALSGREGVYEGEYTSTVTGKTMLVRVLAQGIHTVDGSLIGAIVIFEDIQESTRAETALREREKMQGVLEMAGAVCHELNQPLMAIMGQSELLAMKISPDDKRFEGFSKIIRQVERLKAINQKLMGITRYETKKYLKGKIIDIEKAAK